MNINKKLSQNGEHETATGIDLFKSNNTGDLMYKTEYGKEVAMADQAFVKKSMEEVLDNIQDGFNLDFKKDSVGPKVSFIKVSGANIDEPENRDIIIPGLLEITRGNSGGGIFNYPLDEGYSNNAPAYTAWNTQYIDATNTNWAPLTNIANRTFTTWRNAIQAPSTGERVPPQYVGIKTVMQFTYPESGETRYWLIEFTYWGIGNENDYGFGYDRYEIFPSVFFEQPNVTNYNTPVTVDVISAGVHLAKNHSGNILYNALIEGNGVQGVSPKNTRWNSQYTDTRAGYNGFEDLTNVKSRVYTDFDNAMNGDAFTYIETNLVMHDLTTDLYWKINFNSWDNSEENPGGIDTWSIENAGSDYEDGEAMLIATGGTGESCFVYVTITDGIPDVTYLNPGNNYTVGDILTFSDGVTEDPLTITITAVYAIGAYSYYREVIPQGDAVKFADGTELDTAPNTAGHEITIDNYGNSIIDDTSDNLVTIRGGNPDEFTQLIDNFSGMLIVNDHFDGRVETWIAGGGDTTLLGATNLGGDPCGSTLTMVDSGYQWANNDALEGPFTFTVIKTRNEA